MELANARLHIGSGDVPLRAITPAEYLVLNLMHKTRAGKSPIEGLKIVGTAQSIKVAAEVQEDTATYEEDVTLANGTVIKAGKPVPAGSVLKDAEYAPRTAAGEMSRLRTKYHKQYLSVIFPSPTSPLPETFEEAYKLCAEEKPVEPGEVGNWTDVAGPIKTPPQAPIVKAPAAPKP